VAGTVPLTRLLVAVASLDHKAAMDLLDATPSLATAGLARRDEFFLAERLAQVYEGDTALHAAGFSYDRDMAQDRGSTASDLAHWTTGRGGTGSEVAKAEQRIIIELLGNTTA
jgi:hypothetical protein